tara:strand:+ start:787 stop:1575 length:789 start_codon:yes stop_codon:yes gene_type:complete
MLDQKSISRYTKNGYLVIENAFEIEKINELMDSIAHIIKIEADRIGLHETDKEKLLNEVIIKIKKDHPISSSWIYQTVNNSNIFRKFIYNLELEETISQLINTKNIKSIGTNSPNLRIDVPEDKKNTRSWHQDGHYFLDNSDGYDSLVLWISLVGANKENGTVIICPGSHEEKKITAGHTSADKLVSEQHITPQQIVDKYSKIDLNTKIGDVALIQMDLIHRSGYNSSNKVRYTAQIRYTNLEKDDYTPPQNMIKYSEFSRA